MYTCILCVYVCMMIIKNKNLWNADEDLKIAELHIIIINKHDSRRNTVKRSHIISENMIKKISASESRFRHTFWNGKITLGGHMFI